MRFSIAVMSGLIVLAAMAQVETGARQTQGDMNDSAARELQAAQLEMADLVAELVNQAEGRPETIAKLERAQAAWEAFSDAHIEAFWPSEDARVTYGSVHPMCVTQERTRLTKARIVELRSMTGGVEGDVCACRWPE